MDHVPLRAEIIATVRARVRPFVSAAILEALARIFPGATGLLLERRDAFAAGELSFLELASAAATEEVRLALELPRGRPRKRRKPRRPKSAPRPRPEQGSGKPATAAATVSTGAAPSAVAARKGPSPESPPKRDPKTLEKNAKPRAHVKQPANVIDTWTPRSRPAAPGGSSIPVRVLPPGVFGDQLGGRGPEPESLQDPEEPANDSA